MKNYSESQASERLSTLKSWKFNKNGIEKSYKFDDFVGAMGFITQLAILSEKVNHHAEIFNVYNKVDIRLSTHDAGGVTDKDFDLAEKLEKILT